MILQNGFPYQSQKWNKMKRQSSFGHVINLIHHSQLFENLIHVRSVDFSYMFHYESTFLKNSNFVLLYLMNILAPHEVLFYSNEFLIFHDCRPFYNG